jgi:hypothetical protein
MNALSIISPYKLEGVWVFDDAAVGLLREPFISGADNILDVLAENTPDSASGFKLIGIAGPREAWKDGCVRHFSNISKALQEIFVQASAKRRGTPVRYAFLDNNQRAPSHPESLSQFHS